MQWVKLTYRGPTQRSWDETLKLRTLLGGDPGAFRALERFDAGLPFYLQGPALEASELVALGVTSEPSEPPCYFDATSSSFERAWQRLRRILERLAPEALATLGPPALRDDVVAIEDYIGRPLPDDFRAWLAMHDGGEVHPEGRLMRVAEILATKRGLDEDLKPVANDPAAPSVGVEGVWWHPGWLPLTDAGTGDYACLDLHPALGGQVGQLVEHRHDHPERRALATSLSAWFEALARDLEHGDVVALEDEEGRFEALTSRESWEEFYVDFRAREA